MRFSKVNDLFNGKLEPFDNPGNNDLSYCLFMDTLFNKKVIGQSSFVFKNNRLLSFKCVFYGDEFTPLNEFYLSKFNDSSALNNNMIVFANKKKPSIGKFYKTTGKTAERLLGTYLISKTTTSTDFTQ